VVRYSSTLACTFGAVQLYFVLPIRYRYRTSGTGDDCHGRAVKLITRKEGGGDDDLTGW
jgi:hypothetical protein